MTAQDQPEQELAEQELTVGVFGYDDVAALFSGEVRVEGVTTRMRTAKTIPEIFSRLLGDHEFDVAELG